MNGSENLTALTSTQTRRQLVYGIAVAFGGLAAASSVQGETRPTMTEAQSSGTEGLLTYLHQEIDIKANPQRIYDALLDATQFAAFTGMSAEICCWVLARRSRSPRRNFQSLE